MKTINLNARLEIALFQIGFVMAAKTVIMAVTKTQKCVV